MYLVENFQVHSNFERVWEGLHFVAGLFNQKVLNQHSFTVPFLLNIMLIFIPLDLCFNFVIYEQAVET